MANISKAKLYKNSKAIKTLLEKYHVNNAKVYGFILSNPIGASADLNLLVEFSSPSSHEEDIALEKLTIDLKRLLDLTTVEIHTVNTLRAKGHGTQFVKFSDSSDFITNISQTARPLGEILAEGKEQTDKANFWQTSIERSDLASKLTAKGFENPSELSKEQQKLLITIASEYQTILGNRPYLEDNVYSELSEEAKKIIDHSKHWEPNMAAANNEIAIMQCLINNKVDVNIKDAVYQSTPLHKAILAGNIDMVKLLLENEADISLVDKQGRRPADIALERGRQDIVTLLTEKQRLSETKLLELEEQLIVKFLDFAKSLPKGSYTIFYRPSASLPQAAAEPEKPVVSPVTTKFSYFKKELIYPLNSFFTPTSTPLIRIDIDNKQEASAANPTIINAKQG